MHYAATSADKSPAISRNCSSAASRSSTTSWAITSGGAGRLASEIERQLAALVGHFEEQQVGELLDVVAVAHAVVA